MGIVLNHIGQRIAKRGGDKSLENIDPDEADDTMLIMEIMHRAPNMSPDDYQETFVALRMEYGTDALAAIRSGHVQFELQSTRDMKEPSRES